MTNATLDIANMPIPELAERLDPQGLDLDRKAANDILRGFGDGYLLEFASVRKHLRQNGDLLRVWWNDLADAVGVGFRQPDADLIGYLSPAELFALQLACALATGRPVTDLGRGLCKLDEQNRAVVFAALAIPLQRPVAGVQR